MEDVVRLYSANAALARAGSLRNGAAEMKRIALVDSDTAALSAFLRALNEDYE
ncbi:MAG: hypothetical protein IPJ98_15430 [Bryobacterales bacterium]|nr:hypothetical protein [Bryobacterales bacterium]